MLHGVDIGGPVHRAGEDDFAAERRDVGPDRLAGAEIIEIDVGRDRLGAVHTVTFHEESQVALGDGDHLAEDRQMTPLERDHLAALRAPDRARQPMAGMQRVTGENLGLDIVGEHDRSARQAVEQHRRMDEIGDDDVEILGQQSDNHLPAGARAIECRRQWLGGQHRGNAAQAARTRRGPRHIAIADFGERRREALRFVTLRRRSQGDVEQATLHTAQDSGAANLAAGIGRKQELRPNKQQAGAGFHRTVHQQSD